jgi:two-component system phosphate regulon sensor histidine kinase PhoR
LAAVAIPYRLDRHGTLGHAALRLVGRERDCRPAALTNGNFRRALDDARAPGALSREDGSAMKRFMLPLAVLMAPVVVVLAALAMMDALGWAWAGAGALAIGVGLAVPVRRHVQALEGLQRRIESLSAPGAEVPARADGDPLSADLDQAVARARRAASRRDEDIRSAIAASAAVFEAAPDPLILLDGAHRVVQVNAAARDLVGAEARGRDIGAVLRDPALIEALTEVLGGRPPQVCALSMPGTVDRHYSARVLRLPDKAGEEPRVLVAMHDVTAIRQAQQMRADFVANVSHELRTPLTTLLGFVETLMGPAREDGEARQRFLAIMHQQASRMTRLVRDLLSLSRIEESEHTPPTVIVDLGGVIRAVVDTLELQAQAKDMTFAVDLPADLPAVIGDPDQLAQVFQNLVDNAVKYGRASTQVRIAARASRRPPGGKAAGAVVAVSVSDEGEGIAREHLPRLTERFYRADAGRSRQLGGTGLGLAIVKHIVNRHRGAMTIDSELGKGMRVTIYLPEATKS